MEKIGRKFSIGIVNEKAWIFQVINPVSYAQKGLSISKSETTQSVSHWAQKFSSKFYGQSPLGNFH